MFSSVQFSLVTQLCPTLRPHGLQHTRPPCLGVNPQNLLKLVSSESVMPSNHLILCHSLLLPSIFPSIRVFSSELALHIKQPKYWSFCFPISPSNEYSGLISSAIVQKHQFFGSQLSLWSNSHIHT